MIDCHPIDTRYQAVVGLNAEYLNASTVFGSIINARCRSGSIAVGETLWRCDENGLWTTPADFQCRGLYHVIYIYIYIRCRCLKLTRSRCFVKIILIVPLSRCKNYISIISIYSIVRRFSTQAALMQSRNLGLRTDQSNFASKPPKFRFLHILKSIIAITILISRFPHPIIFFKLFQAHIACLYM